MPNHNDKKIDLSEDMDKVKEVLAQIAHDVKGKAESIVNQSINTAKDKTNNLEEDATNYIKDHPVRVVAFSVVAGMLLAKFLGKNK